MKTDEKSNEITGLPTLLEMPEREGCIVTTDAMGCQEEIAKPITKAQADSVFGLKDNQNTLQDDVKPHSETETAKMKTTTHDKGHGRIETREYFLETNIDWLAQQADWEELNAVGMMK